MMIMQTATVGDHFGTLPIYYCTLPQDSEFLVFCLRANNIDQIHSHPYEIPFLESKSTFDVCMYVCVYVRTSMYVCVCMYVCMYVRVCVCTYEYVCTFP